MNALPDGHTKKQPRSVREIEHLSFSSISTFLKCPRMFAYSYCEQLRRPPGVALIKGSAVDVAASANLTQKIDSHEDLHTDNVQEMAEDAFRTKVDQEGGRDEIDWAGTNQAKALDSAMSLTGLHMTHHAPLIQPIAVQLELRRELPTGREFMGFIDYIKDDGTVGDIKTGSRRLAAGAADKDLQPTAYAFLKGEPIAFEFARVIDSGTRLSEEVVETGRDVKSIEWFGGMVGEIEKSIDAQAFPPNPTSWVCAPKWCGYWQICRGANRPPEFPE